MSSSLTAMVVIAVTTIAVTRWVPVSTDEAWFLQVVRRTTNGDRLYRDVFFGAAPLAVWIAAVAVRFTRPQVIVVRAIGLAYHLAILAAAAALFAVEDVPALPTVATLIGVAGLGGHHAALHNHYGHLTNIGLIGAAAAILAGRPVLAGVALAVAVAGRYPVGILGAVVLVPLSAWAHGTGFAVDVAAGLIAVGALVVAVGWGEWRAFYRTAVANKPTYLAVAGISLLAGLSAVRTRADSVARRIEAVPVLVGYALLVPCGGIAAIAAVSGFWSDRPDRVIAAALVVCGMAVVYPRADRAHVVAAMPLMVVGAGLACAELSGLVWWTAAAGAGAVAMAGIGGRMLVTRAGIFRRDLPRLRGLPAPRLRGVWADDTEEVRRIAGSRVFVLRADAAYFYLCGGLENPTPYDYPFASTFGSTGQAKVIDAIRRGQVTWVCGSMVAGSAMVPEQLAGFVAKEMDLVASTPVGPLSGFGTGE